ncbi:hypothetical protein ACU4GD_45445 [Cupriavidus basilensis]
MLHSYGSADLEALGLPRRPDATVLHASGACFIEHVPRSSLFRLEADRRARWNTLCRAMTAA